MKTKTTEGQLTVQNTVVSFTRIQQGDFISLTNSITLSPSKWIEATGAVGIRTTAGRTGGTYAHQDIAFEFASWLSTKCVRFWAIAQFGNSNSPMKVAIAGTGYVCLQP